ncbi:hypothetical protein JHV675_51890 [Mycobacterium avium subsp. hominissuis]
MAGRTYVTTPGSALLFPSLCVPTGEPARPVAAGSPVGTHNDGNSSCRMRR